MNKYIIVLIVIIIVSVSLGMAILRENYTIITGNSIVGNTSSTSLRYDPNNYDTVFHPEYPGYGNKDLAGNIVYYQPGSFTYGASSYVPYYEDSVFLSRSNKAIVNAPTYVDTSAKGGFCNYYSTQPEIIEQKCNAIDSATCAATECCVLLGGQKCVSGNHNGPIMKANYNDFSIVNKDYYYYKGKCYGNCPNPNPPVPPLATPPPQAIPPPPPVIGTSN
jgi:hypothetical protein